MAIKKFDPKNLAKLNNPKRYQALPPEFILKRAALKNPRVIIDLGAGTGFYSTPFADYYQDCQIYACDISEVMLAWMRENILPKYNNIIPLKMQDGHVPLNDNLADFLFMINLHHELERPEKILAEAYRLLQPGGKIIISDWKKEKTQQGPALKFRYQANEIKTQLSVAGFKKISISLELPQNYLILAEKPTEKSK